MTLSRFKTLLNTNSIPYQEREFENETAFVKYVIENPCIGRAKDNKHYALIIQSNNGNKHIILEFEEKNNEYVFWDLWFGDFSFEYFLGDAAGDNSYLMDKIQELIKGTTTIVSVTNAKTKRWIADAQFDRNDTEDDLFGEVGFQKTMKRIQKKKSFLERLFFAERKYEIYDWNTYKVIIK